MAIGTATEARTDFTILGATGFIGRHLAGHLRRAGHTVFSPRRSDPRLFSQPLGHVIYAIGITADFRSRPFDTMEAHVSVLGDILRRTRFESFTYLSSTRVYDGAASTDETADLRVNPSNPSDLYNLSKLAGEALCLTQPDERIRIARLSNVYGSDMDSGAEPSQNFLAAIIREAALDNHIVLHTAAESSKDYVAIEDVRRALIEIALNGTHRIYNVAAGRNVSHAAITDALAGLTGCRVSVTAGAPMTAFPEIDTDRLVALFSPPKDAWMPQDLIDALPRMASRHLREPAVAGGTR